MVERRIGREVLLREVKNAQVGGELLKDQNAK
jgi:hypothetical protein